MILNILASNLLKLIIIIFFYKISLKINLDNKLHDFPNEIKIKIFKLLDIEDFIKSYFYLKDFKNILDFIINEYDYSSLYKSLKININQKFIIVKNYPDKWGIKSIKRQVVTIDNIDIYNENGKLTYVFDYYYGVFGYHEGYAYINEIQDTTKEQKHFIKKGQFWKLPQQFYQC